MDISNSSQRFATNLVHAKSNAVPIRALKGELPGDVSGHHKGTWNINGVHKSYSLIRTSRLKHDFNAI